MNQLDIILNRLPRKAFISVLAVSTVVLLLSGCDLIRMKKDQSDEDATRKAVARVNDTYLYLDELEGIVTASTPKEDSAGRMTAYVNSWIRKQLLINEALKRIDINEAEVERKILDYRYSLIGYQFQKLYIQQNLTDSVSDQEIEAYYAQNIDNFILKQNIIKGTFIKVPQGAPRVNRIKDLIFSNKEKDRDDLRSYCLSFSSAYHLSDSSWIEFDKLVVNSPLAEIPNKIQFLKSYPYYETSDAGFLYYLKIDAYKISDNVSPLEFVKEDIKNIIINKRKVELARKLEEEVYENAAESKDFEIFN
ncbi:MAG TPA: peptidyl-prolyl cis-trans isomerase [Cyclobacteriaceae bacterium]|nr:peptidyl-prolyl cis-trans isomerase [Cyclobacteriaceae bacterium]